MKLKEMALWGIAATLTVVGAVSCFGGPPDQPKQVMVVAQEQQLVPGAIIGDPDDPTDDLVSISPEDLGFNPIEKADGSFVKLYIVPESLVLEGEQVIKLGNEDGIKGWATDPDTYWGLLDLAKTALPGAAATFAGIEVFLGILTPRKRELYKKAASEAGLSSQEMITAVKTVFQALGATHSRDDEPVEEDDSATTLNG